LIVSGVVRDKAVSTQKEGWPLGVGRWGMGICMKERGNTNGSKESEKEVRGSRIDRGKECEYESKKHRIQQMGIAAQRQQLQMYPPHPTHSHSHSRSSHAPSTLAGSGGPLVLHPHKHHHHPHPPHPPPNITTI